MPKFEKKVFRKEVIPLDGNQFYACKFEECEIVFTGIATDLVLDGNSFVNCSWSFDGPAARTIAFMGALYKMEGDAMALIEATFDNIRGVNKAGEKTLILNPLLYRSGDRATSRVDPPAKRSKKKVSHPCK